MQTYLTYLKHLFLFLQIDPLYYGKINMDPSEKAHLYSGDKVRKKECLYIYNSTLFTRRLLQAQGCQKVNVLRY